MKYFYSKHKPKSDLPIDEDRNPPMIRLTECPHCGQKRMPYFHFTEADLSRSKSAELRRCWRALIHSTSDNPLERWPDYERLAALLQEEHPGSFVTPGVYGGLTQLAVGRIVDMSSPGVGVIVLKRSLFELLVAKDLHLECWPVRARYSKRIADQEEEYVELVARPAASAAPDQGLLLCPKCHRCSYDEGWNGVLDPRPCALHGRSVPKETNAFRIRECPSIVIVSERLVAAVAGMDCGNIMWCPVEVS